MGKKEKISDNKTQNKNDWIENGYWKRRHIVLGALFKHVGPVSDRNNVA
jgi:hypothetical protein